MDEKGIKHLTGGYGRVYVRGNSQISFLEASIFLLVFNMSATMARQGGRVKLELSNMLLAGNMANMTNGRFSCAAIEETQHLMKKPRPKVQEERKQRVVIPAHRNVKAAKERQPAMLLENNTNRCVTCQNGTVKNPQTWWRRIGMAAAVPD